MSLTKYLRRSLSDSNGDAINRICMLKPMQPEHQLIHLNTGANIVGRSRETGIRDARCSKKQLELNVNIARARVKLKVLGLNPCSVNGLMVMHGTECDLEHGDVVEIVYGRHQFELIFKPPPTTANENPVDNGGINVSAARDSWCSSENGKLLVFTSVGVRASDKIAAYDLDGTIIKTKSGNVFPKNTDDWQINYPVIPEKLKRLQADGYKICLMTNQAGIAKGKVNLDEFKEKVRQILQKLNIPAQVFIATDNGYYRKPLPGMWEYLSKEMNDNVTLKIEKCFYVGDAAGRPEQGTGVSKRKKDHSFVDRFFAANVGISFYTPEEHFLNRKTEEWTRPDFEPSAIHANVAVLEPQNVKIPAPQCEMVIMVGLPGSGKSHFARKHLEPLGYSIINADTLGNTQACLKACQRAIDEGNSCVVDNTNVDVSSRKKFIELAQQQNVPCRCFVMNATLAQVKHNLAFRHLTDTKHTTINDMILNMMKKKYKSPTLDEGFTEIAKVNIKPTFDSVKEEQLYKLYLIEK